MIRRVSLVLAELKHRKVTRSAVWYCVVGAGVIEGLNMVFDVFALPLQLWRYLAIVVICGLPIALVLSWFYEFSSEGIRRTVPATPHELVAHRSAGWSNASGWMVAAVLLTFVVWQVAAGPPQPYAALVDLERAADAGDWIAAYRLAGRISADVPDSTRARALAAVSRAGVLRTDPAGATVHWRAPDDPDTAWTLLGRTPLTTRFPRSRVLLRVQRDGHQPLLLLSSAAQEEYEWRLLRADEPGGAVRVSGGVMDLTVTTLRLAPAQQLDDYLIDLHEVTNEQFQVFVDSGGYRRPELWEHDLEKDGRKLPWVDAMALMVDRTGRPGPATWEVGRYLAGTADHPVTGVSWYEAAAYARFAGRQLPTIYHWYRAANVSDGEAIIPFSNSQGEGTAPVGQFPAVSLAGLYDMAGNAREWAANASGTLRYTLGGGWNDSDYLFVVPQPQPPFDRSPGNGFRLMTDLGDGAAYDNAARPYQRMLRDYASEKPVTDDVFEAFRAVYAYDDAPLNAVVDRVDTVAFGIRERVVFDAAYGSERMVLYLFRPLEATGPLQTVVYFPGLSALSTRDIAEITGPRTHPAFLVQSGRAVAFPVLKSSFEREDEYVYGDYMSQAHREHVIQWSQDVRRSIDYLETRSDLRQDGFAFFGYSFGGMFGPITLALEPRLVTAVLHVGGLSVERQQPVTDPFNFVSRVRVPTLLLSATFDGVFPLESSARPLFHHLGSTEKQHFISTGGHSYDSGHFVAREEVVRESLAWLDRYLGPVR